MQHLLIAPVLPLLRLLRLPLPLRELSVQPIHLQRAFPQFLQRVVDFRKTGKLSVLLLQRVQTSGQRRQLSGQPFHKRFQFRNLLRQLSDLLFLLPFPRKLAHIFRFTLLPGLSQQGSLAEHAVFSDGKTAFGKTVPNSFTGSSPQPFPGRPAVSDMAQDAGRFFLQSILQLRIYRQARKGSIGIFRGLLPGRLRPFHTDHAVQKLRAFPFNPEKILRLHHQRVQQSHAL